MNEILNQLGQLFVQTIPTIIFVFLLLIILEWLFFNPLKRVLGEREEASTGALAKAREQMAVAEAKAKQYEASLLAARQGIYEQKDQTRRRSLEEREKALKRARDQAEILIREAKVSISKETMRAREELLAACHSLAQEITDVIVGGGGGKTQGGGPAV